MESSPSAPSLVRANVNYENITPKSFQYPECVLGLCPFKSGSMQGGMKVPVLFPFQYFTTYERDVWTRNKAQCKLQGPKSVGICSVGICMQPHLPFEPTIANVSGEHCRLKHMNTKLTVY